MQYSRSHPSPRYRELAALYARMHAEGDPRLGLAPEKTFPGTSLSRHVGRIKRLIDATGARTILDYGSGKGLQYRPHKVMVEGKHVADGIAEYWDVDEVRCYDPGCAPYGELPDEKFDGVVCTDVLEHLPEEDLAWILDEIAGFAEKFVYLNVACFPAKKTLPNGENAHATVREPDWWAALLRERLRGRSLEWELHAAAAGGEKIFGSSAPSEPDVTEAVIEGRTARFHTPNEMTRWRVATLYTKEPVTIEWLRAMAEGAVFADVGANVGMYSVFAALARSATVVAFEPESENYAILNRNIRMNSLGERVTALCAGLSDARGVQRLYLSKAKAGGSGHSLGAEVGFDLKPRPAAFVQGSLALRLDELVEAGEVPAPQYVKIDVDGLEHKVIRGMERTLSAVRSLLVELNPSLPEHVGIRAYLESVGFKWDPRQVAAAARKSSAFQGVAEHVFSR